MLVACSAGDCPLCTVDLFQSVQKGYFVRSCGPAVGHTYWLICQEVKRNIKGVPDALFLLCSFMFDEPSSYLDVKQRLKAAQAIRSLLAADKYVIVVEHDLSVLDYLSDFICCLYGLPGAYGVVTMPFSVREGMLLWLF